MNTGAPFLVTFEPIGRFFFGSNRTFIDGFYVESMKLPQQTTILGCLRKTILKQNKVEIKKGRIPDTSDPEVVKLTGTSRINGLDDSDDNLGIIQSVSPVFISKHDSDKGLLSDALFELPSDVRADQDKLITFRYETNNNALSYYSGFRKDYVIKSTRDNKSYKPEYWGGKDFWSAYCKGSDNVPLNQIYKDKDVFIKDTSVGIGRIERVADEGMFYTKIEYSLKKGFRFAVILWLSDSDKLQSDIVGLGGESSTFRLSIEPINKDSVFESHPLLREILDGDKMNPSKSFSIASKGQKIVVISAVLCNANIYDCLEHSIIDKISNIRMLAPSQKIEKTDAYCMIPSCSILFPLRGFQINSSVLPFKIGYNSVITLNTREVK